MASYKKSISSFLISLLCILTLALLLTACDFGGSSSAAPTPTATTAAPTTAPTKAPSSNLATFTGNGFTIGYPKDWKVDRSQQGVVTFSDPQGIAYLYVHVSPNPAGIISPEQQVDAGLQLFQSKVKNYQPASIAPTASVGGDSWTQKAATGDLTTQGQTVPAKIVVLADNHPANSPNTQGFTIAYATGQQVFDIANEGEFQPMLRSFSFS